MNKSKLEVPLLVTPQFALENFPLLKFIDARWFVPKPSQPTGIEEYQRERIKGAVHFDIDAISDKSITHLPHQMPSGEYFANIVGNVLGISESDNIVIYDHIGLFAAPRVWYMFVSFGAKNVGILHGGFNEWKKMSFPTDSSSNIVAPNPTTFNISISTKFMTNMNEILIPNRSFLLLDARSKGRFNGTEPEPRPIPSGHIEGSINFPWNDIQEIFHNNEDPSISLKNLFQEINIHTPIVTMCGSGVSACVTIFALYYLGVPLSAISLYGGSWTEYALTYLCTNNK